MNDGKIELVLIENLCEEDFVDGEIEMVEQPIEWEDVSFLLNELSPMINRFDDCEAYTLLDYFLNVMENVEFI